MTVFFANGKPYSFNTLLRNWHEDTKYLMQDLGTVGVNFFQDRFRKAAWLDRRQQKWKPRQSTQEDIRNPKRRALLVKTGKLRNSIHLAAISRNTATIAATAPYAAAHNFGFKGIVYVKPHGRRRFKNVDVYNIKSHRRSSRKTELMKRTHVRGHSRRMNLPQRQFMGNSSALNQLCVKHIKHLLKDLHKN